MTKLRPPLGVEAAIGRVVAQLPKGYETAGKALGRSARFVRALGEPDRREQLRFTDAIRLDKLFRRNGGSGAPLLESYQLQLGVADLHNLVAAPNIPAAAIDVVREGAEAVAAQIAVTLPGADERTRAAAIRETEELVQAGTRALAHLQSVPLGPGNLPRPPDDAPG